MESFALCVHHIDFNPFNNDRKNLISVCKSCHKTITNQFYSACRRYMTMANDLDKKYVLDQRLLFNL